MNANSYICNFIFNHKEDWEQILIKDYELRIRFEGDFAVFNYSITANFFDPIVQEARGIIIDVKNLEVVCWPFRKFGNYNEGYADKINWQSAKVLEKVDGSIIKLWFNNQKGDWQFSTNKTIYAENAPVEDCPGLSYFSVIKRAKNYGDIPFDRLNKEKTYIFELVSPQTQVVINYGETMLYHIGTRNNLTGQETDEDIGIKKPMLYTAGSLEDCVKLASTLNQGQEDISKEGFVVVDKNFNRVKVKSLEYIAKHHTSTLACVSKKDCIYMLINARERINILFGERGQFEHVVKYYDYKLSEKLFEAEKIATFALNLYEEYSCDRKAVASVLKNYPLAFVGFKSIDTKLGGREIFLDMPIDKICAYIPDYEEINPLKK